ncbi:MAG: FAD-binding oxidoreductase [Chlamydiae bacterium]|nr:FAD-binding oxidoreductase [Chlamydiota bacterium]MBI3267300.1 FAD-binding oxidoreductase [Chlamydiota bacterium]
MTTLYCTSAKQSPLDTTSSLLRKTDPAEFQEYLQDASRMVGGNALAVIFPQTEEQISQYLKNASQKNTPVTIAGNHTGLVGGAIPLGGEVIATLLFSKTYPQPGEDVFEILEGHDELTNIPYQFYLKREEDKIIAVVPPGLRLGEFQKRMEALRLFYPPDPTETTAFLGGTIATNASGARTFKYGATRAHVHALRIALSQGGILNLERGKNFSSKEGTFELISEKKKVLIAIPHISMPSIKHAAGYFCKPEMDLIDLWIGSEGTLGVVTQIELVLQKKPSTVLSAIAFFQKENTALHFVQTLREEAYRTWRTHHLNGMDIRAIEYFDGESLNLLRKNPLGTRVPEKAECALFLEQESSIPISRESLENLMSPLFEERALKPQEEKSLQDHPFGKLFLLLKGQNVLNDLELAFPGEEKHQQNLREFRHEIPKRVNEIIGLHKRESGLSSLHKVGTDTAVPDEFFIPMMNFFRETLQKSEIQYVIFGHMGNNHLHANLLPKNETELRESKKIYLELCKQAVSMHGTVSAEHGIGKLKHSSLEILYPRETLTAMANLKRALDPTAILGRGNIFSVSF